MNELTHMHTITHSFNNIFCTSSVQAQRQHTKLKIIVKVLYVFFIFILYVPISSVGDSSHSV